jgi:hypothetical protein
MNYLRSDSGVTENYLKYSCNHRWFCKVCKIWHRCFGKSFHKFSLTVYAIFLKLTATVEGGVKLLKYLLSDYSLRGTRAELSSF